MDQPSQQIAGKSYCHSEQERLLNEVKSLQARLERLFDISCDAGTVASEPLEGSEAQRRARNIIRLRRRREALFGRGLFGEPAWDMLLELYVAELAGRRECVSGLCCVSGVPSTTALRWIGLLENAGWISRTADPRDGRRSFLSLTRKARAAMDSFFAQPELVQVL